MAGYTKAQTPVEFEDETLGGSRATEAGGLTIAFEAWKAGVDTTPLFKGLPGDSCQAPHWGYLLTGEFRVKTNRGDEVIRAGQAYYLAPGHNIVIDHDVELVEFTPTEERNKTMAHAAQQTGTPA